MKKIFLISFAFFISFLGINNLKAYTTLGYYNYDSGTNERISPIENSSITSIPPVQFTNNGSQILHFNPSLYDIGQYTYIGGAYGTNLIVHADYYLGIRTEYNGFNVHNESYLTDSRNTLKQSNLKCGLGNYYQGYDNTNSPQITNFMVDYSYGEFANYDKVYLYHITYDYKQQINEVNLNSTNLWCGFANSINDGLFAQFLNLGSPYYYDTYYYSYINSFTYSVSSDPNTELLQGLQSQNDIIIQQNTEINNSINNVENSINDLAEQQSENQKVCKKYDVSSITSPNSYLGSNGTIYSSDLWGITDYIKIDSTTKINILTPMTNNGVYYCFYNSNKNIISCNTITNFNNISIPNNATYLRVSIHQNYNAPQFEVCNNGNQAISSSIDDLKDTLTDSDVSDSEIENALQFNVSNNSYGLFTTFLTLPLNWVQSLLGSQGTCQSVIIPLPFLNEDLTLPCMDTFWNSLGALNTLIRAIWIAVVAIRVFNGFFLLTAEVMDTSDDSAMKLTKIQTWEL